MVISNKVLLLNTFKTAALNGRETTLSLKQVKKNVYNMYIQVYTHNKNKKMKKKRKSDYFPEFVF